jgi:protein ImuB
MRKRFVSIWFRYLCTDWFSIRQPQRAAQPFVLTIMDHGRVIISDTSRKAAQLGIFAGMPLADARALQPALEAIEAPPQLKERLLKALAAWSIRYTPVAAIDLPDGILLDASGCAHLWGGEEKYLTDICNRFTQKGYAVMAAMADTPLSAHAFARFSQKPLVVPSGELFRFLPLLPVTLFGLPAATCIRLQQLGLYELKHCLSIPRRNLRRRFGDGFLQQLDKLSGAAEDWLEPVVPPVACQERLPCLEPIVTATGIAIALELLLGNLCTQLEKEAKGLRKAVLTCHRTDGKSVAVSIGTHRASHNRTHLFKLFEPLLSTIDPAEGIELFILDAPVTEPAPAVQEILWGDADNCTDLQLAELMDRIGGRLGDMHIARYLPDEHYWPERSIKKAQRLDEAPLSPWQPEAIRPVHLLPHPEPVEVTAPIPDYPPMLFRHNGKLHTIKKADGPERIEREWWIEEGVHRDYYSVEDETGQRYWIFRSGHYTGEKNNQWFLHGYFA